MRTCIVVAALLLASALSAQESSEPEITADAWVIQHANSGEVIAAHNPSTPRKIASITKVMCAVVVLDEVRRNPDLLEEMVPFSPLAVAALGTKTGLEAGESISMRDALYGLMLPSGNDAGNALAEYFADRFDPPPADQEIREVMTTRANFVAEMNRKAADLGMVDSIFRLPFGDGGAPTDHTSTAADMLKATRIGMDDPLFRRIVQAAEYTATVYRPDGTTREVTWQNTNKFLGEEGFVGVKTGTTRHAGACLLTAYHRGGVPVFVLVLGSKGTDTRYADTALILERHFPAAGE